MQMVFSKVHPACRKALSPLCIPVPGHVEINKYAYVMWFKSYEYFH